MQPQSSALIALKISNYTYYREIILPEKRKQVTSVTCTFATPAIAEPLAVAGGVVEM